VQRVHDENGSVGNVIDVEEDTSQVDKIANERNKLECDGRNLATLKMWSGGINNSYNLRPCQPS
jgi:hypothetical protein